MRPTATAFALLLAAAAGGAEPVPTLTVRRATGAIRVDGDLSDPGDWQTALYVGYGDERALDERDELHHTSRQLFAKVSYAFQK